MNTTESNPSAPIMDEKHLKEEFAPEGKEIKQNESSHSVKVSKRIDEYTKKMETQKGLIELGKLTAIKDLNKKNDKERYSVLVKRCDELKGFDCSFFISKIKQAELVPKGRMTRRETSRGFQPAEGVKSNDILNRKLDFTVGEIDELKLFRTQLISVISYINCFVILNKMNNERIIKLRGKVKEYKEESKEFEEQTENYISQLDTMEDKYNKLKDGYSKLEEKFDYLVRHRDICNKVHSYAYPILISFLIFFYNY